MSTFKGLLTLQSPQDVLAKLEHDYQRLKQSPMDPYIAFDFFVTAEHMVDWLFPADGDAPKRKEMRGSSVLLEVCSHIASGAKHFHATARRHRSVEKTVERPAARFGVLEIGVSRLGTDEGLEIQLQGEAAQQLGD